MKYFLFILLPFFAQAQTTTTLTDAVATTNTFLTTSAYTIANGDTGVINFKQNYNGSVSSPLPLEVARIDFTTGHVTYKTMPGSLSSSSALWRAVQDNSGRWYFGLNTNNRHVWRIDTRDTIALKDFGDCYAGFGNLAYSMSLGNDGNIYLGGSSSNQSTRVSYIDLTNDSVHTYNELDPFQDYVVAVWGDTTYFYGITGQRNNTFDLWAIRKSDGYEKKIATQTGLINNGLRQIIGAVFQINGVWYKVKDTTLTPEPNYFLYPDIYHCEINNNAQCGNAYPTVTSSFDPATSTVSYNASGHVGSVSVSSTTVSNTVREIYPDTYDSTAFYYIGEYYGDLYKNNTSTDLGFIGFNVYSELQVNDSTIFFGGYSSGVLAKWNKNQPWTAEKPVNGVLQHLSATTNPRLITYYRTYGGFHHCTFLVKIDTLLVGAGPAERVANTWGIATADLGQHTAYGYDYTKNIDIDIRDAKAWRKKVIVSTQGTGAKLYVYDPYTNLMDSIETGFTDNGKLYVCGDKLIGVANNRIYNYNLATRTLINSHSYATNSITFSSQMPDGRILITSVGITLPTDMTFTFVPYSTSLNDINYAFSQGYTIPNSGANVTRLNNYFYPDQNITTPAGILKLVQRKVQ